MLHPLVTDSYLFADFPICFALGAKIGDFFSAAKYAVMVAHMAFVAKNEQVIFAVVCRILSPMWPHPVDVVRIQFVCAATENARRHPNPISGMTETNANMSWVVWMKE